MVAARADGRAYGTMPYKVFEQLFRHPLTDQGLEGFLKEWEKAREALGDVFETARARNAGHSAHVAIDWKIAAGAERLYWL